MLIGAYQSSCSFTATAVASAMAFHSWSANSAALNITGRGFKWVFRGTPIASDYAATYMRFFDDMKKQGKKIASIAVVNENTDYGTSVADSIEAAAKKNNIAVAIANSLQRELDRRVGAGPAAQGKAARRRDLHQLHVGFASST